MKEFTVCYTLDNEIITEKIITEINFQKEDVEREIVKKMEHNQNFIVKNDQGYHMIHSYLVRYVRVMNEKVLVK